MKKLWDSFIYGLVEGCVATCMFYLIMGLITWLNEKWS